MLTLSQVGDKVNLVMAFEAQGGLEIKNKGQDCLFQYNYVLSHPFQWQEFHSVRMSLIRQRITQKKSKPMEMLT